MHLLANENWLRWLPRFNCTKEKRIHLRFPILPLDKAALVTGMPLYSLPCEADTGHGFGWTPAASSSKLDPLHPRMALPLPSPTAAAASGHPRPYSSSWAVPGQGGCSVPGSPPFPVPPRARAGSLARITKISEMPGFAGDYILRVQGSSFTLWCWETTAFVTQIINLFFHFL